MVLLGATIAVVMGRFEAHQLHQADPTFLSIPFYDMLAFGIMPWLAIFWRSKPELQRRLLVCSSS